MTATGAVAATPIETGSSGELPEGFSQLASARVVFLDVYFGGRKVTESLAEIRPGTLRFRTPSDLLAKLPNVIGAPELAAALSAGLPTNSDSVCSQSNANRCGVITP